MAIFSDIHANRQAWDALQRDILKAGVDTSVCLGDIVGYGPEPQAVLDAVRNFTSNIVIGNHDAVVAGRMDPADFNPTARAVIEWTATQLDEESRTFLAGIPEMILGEDLCLVHAESAVPMRFTYLFQAPDSIESFSARAETITFVGHTHHPTVFALETATGTIVQREPLNFQLEPGYRYIVNTGSSGEPRDYDVRGSYVIYDTEARTVEFRRVPFDIHAYCRDLATRRLNIEPHFLKVYKYKQEVAEWEAARMQAEIPEETTLMRPVTQVAPAKSQPVALNLTTGKVKSTKRRRKKQPKGPLIALILIILLLGGLGYAVFWVKGFLEESQKPVEKAGSAVESSSAG